jgi:hypothetical protein
VLREWFRAWGLPERFRVDNGTPWGSSGDLPPDLALWLLGLGIDMHWNHAVRPQENGVVERSQGTAKRWAEPGACDTVAALQEAMDRMDRIQRESYPVDGQLSRQQVWPALSHSGRAYTRTWERQNWNFSRVLNHLADYVVTRKVTNNGRVSIYNRTRYVGCLHQGKTAYIMFDPQEIQWIIADANGHQLTRIPATEITSSNINHLTVAKRPEVSRSQRSRAAKLE